MEFDFRPCSPSKFRIPHSKSSLPVIISELPTGGLDDRETFDVLLVKLVLEWGSTGTLSCGAGVLVVSDLLTAALGILSPDG